LVSTENKPVSGALRPAGAQKPPFKRRRPLPRREVPGPAGILEKSAAMLQPLAGRDDTGSVAGLRVIK
jgi:hypothetical protein